MRAPSNSTIEARERQGAEPPQAPAGFAILSPQANARIAGVFYLLNIITGALAVVFSSRKEAVYSDAANLVATACYVVVTVLFYTLFKPVNRNVSLLAALFSLAGCIVGALSQLHIVAAPVNPLVLFGCYCLLIGYLIFRSTFLPHWVGVLMAIASLGWLTFLSPPLAASLAPYNLAPGIIGESALTLWLLVKGVNVEQWQRRAAESTE
jgi:uncharacterized protein DUF4386